MGVTEVVDGGGGRGGGGGWGLVCNSYVFFVYAIFLHILIRLIMLQQVNA